MTHRHIRSNANIIRRKLQCTALLVAAFLVCAVSCRAQFTEPTKEELSMTSLPGYPGAAAVVLFREEITKDDLHVVQHYERIKILTEEGKKYANVELPYVTFTDTVDGSSDDKTLDQIHGRTIHSDGTIIPFTGKPYLKVMVKAQRNGIQGKYQAKIFTLPDVEVGSIIEYRYATRINDYVYEAPSWYIQGDLYVKAAHYMWYPTIHELASDKGDINSITWFPILPPGAQLQHHVLPGDAYAGGGNQIYELSIKDVPPVKHEQYMPPTSSFSYRVIFNYQPYSSYAEYWKSEGKNWSKSVNSFADVNGDLRSATDAIIAGAPTQDLKLRKIYAAVMALENTDYTREHDVREDKANGLSKYKHADDVLNNKRGNSTQLTELFVAMARAAGMTADFMYVPDRSNEIFTEYWLSFSQFDDLIAIVNVDGKEVFFDPGSRYCPYGHLAWQHTFVRGIRQKDGETTFDHTPGDDYRSNMVARVANLNLDEAGHITGSVDLSYMGASALGWRQIALRGDEESLKHDLRTHLEDMLPRSLEVKDVAVTNVADYEQPLNVHYTVSGTLGTWAGKRLILPADLFLANAKATFPDPTRDIAVYFHYSQFVRDALRVKFPPTFSLEATPAVAKFQMSDLALYGMNVTPAANNFTTRRDFAYNTVIFLPKEYPQLRSFYSQFEANDQQSVVLKSTSAVTAAATTPHDAN